jgi:hypothetical protein
MRKVFESLFIPLREDQNINLILSKKHQDFLDMAIVFRITTFIINHMLYLENIWLILSH